MELNRKPRLLLIEGDVNLGYLLEENLVANGLDVVFVRECMSAAQELIKGNFEVCLADVTLAEVDQLVIDYRNREDATDMPFVFLTPDMQQKDRIQSFEMGRDDYIIKPFSFKELHYRVMGILIRTNAASPPIAKKMFSIGSTTLLSSKRILSINGTERKLSHREAELLKVLMSNKGEFVTRSEILLKVWGRDDYYTAKSMDVYINRIRKLIRDDASLEIENLYGTGYRILQNNESAIS